MKRIFIFVLAVLLIFAGCNEEKNPLAQSSGEEALIIPDENAPAKMTVTKAYERVLIAEITNISEDEIIFSEDFNIQIYEDGKWNGLEIIPENAVFTEPAYPVEPGETREHEVSFAWLYGSLSEGRYRIIKTVSAEINGKYEHFKVSAEFTLPFGAESLSSAPEVSEIPEKEIETPIEKPEINLPEKPFEPIQPGNKTELTPIENTFVLRANSSRNGGESLMWSRYAYREQQDKRESPIMIFASAKELESFVSDMGGYYQFGSGENSAREKILSHDDAFFEENALIITHRQTGSGSVRYTVTEVTYYGSSCHIVVNAQMPEVGTADMADWFILIEQPKEKIENCKEFGLSIT